MNYENNIIYPFIANVYINRYLIKNISSPADSVSKRKVYVYKNEKTGDLYAKDFYSGELFITFFFDEKEAAKDTIIKFEKRIQKLKKQIDNLEKGKENMNKILKK